MMGMDEPDADEIGGLSDSDTDDFGAYEPKDEFEREAKDFLDDTKPMGERLMALKEAIRICSEKDYGSSSSGSGDKGGGLAMIFGAPKKKS